MGHGVILTTGKLGKDRQGSGMNMNAFEERLADCWGQGLHGQSIETIQVNLTLRCNQCCQHCHVKCSPERTEEMDWPTMELILTVAQGIGCTLVDLTGGAPELNAHFCRFVRALCQAGLKVQVRTNLTVLLEEGMQVMAEFLAQHKVALVASMPCYLEKNVDRQRGKGAYRRSVQAIKRLNALGYSRQDDLQLNLVYNPMGAFLPPPQVQIEADYRRELQQRFGIEFSRLLTITNMPIGRFGAELRRSNQHEKYMFLLSQAFNPQTVENLMCRHQISVGWDGKLYDCDFNLALDCPVNHGAPSHIRAFDESVLAQRRIVTGNYCFGCTAGAGSSCAGSLI